MVDVIIKETRSKKRKKKLYIVAIVDRSKGIKRLSYQGRFSSKKDAIKRRNKLVKQLRG